MKILNKTRLIVAMATMLTAATGCKKYLEESPKSALFPSYFSTPGGVLAGITGVYNDLRQNFFAGEGIVFFLQGTDEVIAGGSSTNPVGASYNGVTSSNSVGFSNLYTDINTLNGVIQFAPSANLDAPTKAAYIAQAKFLRAWIYFFLVQTYGGTTATQKSGIALHTTFITEANNADAPATLSAIYTQIIQDFTDAAAALPTTITATNPFSAGGIGKSATVAVANLYLAKAYLTRGYTEAAVTGDFQKAADLTAALIANKGTYGLDLWQDYNDVNKPANDYGKENMFNIDYGGLADAAYTGDLGSPAGGNGINALYVLARFNYVGPGVDNVAGIDAVPQVVGTKKPGMLRDVFNGRPYVRIAPNTPYTINQAFADQVHDCRYDATFQTYWICNVATAAGLKSDGVTLKGQLTPCSNVSLSSYQAPIGGDTAILMPGTNSVTMARRDAFKGLIVTPAQYTNVIFPTVKKFDDPARLQTSDFSTRPIVLLRFSEAYMVNAEANYMLGNYTNAATSLNVIRQRAAFRSPADANSVANSAVSVTAATQAAVNASCAAAMALTPAQLAQLSIPNNTTVGSGPCGMDLILDEYTREYYGDPRRWYDLVRTGQLIRRVKQYNSIAGPNIQPFHARRPIPQTLIQNVSSGPAYPQNNGY
ncbi:RagB/SusD family nutrient uptake outer membrane protein [Mucilaginibacter sp. AW1-3]